MPYAVRPREDYDKYGARKFFAAFIVGVILLFAFILWQSPIQHQPGPVATVVVPPPAIPTNSETVKVVSKSPNDNAQVIFPSDHPVEVCYKGVTYVYFNNGTASWGSVMFDKWGDPVECD